jgi:hypothetical protein
MPRYGSKTRHDHHRRITEIVAKYARQSMPMSFAAWPLTRNVRAICTALDELQIPIPSNWKEGRTPSLRRLGLHLIGWSDALDLGYEHLVVRQIRYSIAREQLIDSEQMSLSSSADPHSGPCTSREVIDADATPRAHRIGG